jgi:NADPH:quinone reductase-like Zn-dependent oxidoreductase
MKAAVVTRYGSPEVVKIRHAPKPAPKPGEALIRVHAATVNRTDCGELRPHPFFARLFYGLRRPKRTIFGMDFAGAVEAVGAGTTSFKPGDRVFGMCPSRRNGAQAEYFCMPETGPIASMPAGARFDEAVVCEGAFYADAGLRKLRLGPGHEILIYGASGAIGTAALQLAKYYGAEVTAVVATRHLDLVRRLGADRAVDYTAGELEHLEQRFDFVFDAVGKMTILQWRGLLKPGGVFAATDLGPWSQNLLFLIWSAFGGGKRVVIPLPERASGHAFVAFLKSRMEAGQFRAVIDRRYRLDEIADAYRYVESGEKTGIVVIDVMAPDESGRAGESDAASEGEPDPAA